uniref:Ribosomal protein S8 n=1 Tax=Rhizaria sp. TaxID=2204297 RepID=A0A5P8DJT6_9EUKA|nr:ribosomal protein S8 [Rhizaria sp.]
MLSIHRFKLVLAKIKIAQLTYKKILKIKLFSIDLRLLNILWRNGYIYGYSKINGFYFIYLKYNLQGKGLLSSVIFLNKNLSRNQIYNLLMMDPYYCYFIMSIKGFIFVSVKNPIINCGGKLIAKL